MISLYGCGTRLQPIILASFNKSNTYFLSERKMSWFDLKISIPRKYFKEPKSLISNYFANLLLSYTISTSSFHVTNMSSTYAIRVVILITWCLRDNVWYAWACLWPTLTKVVMNHSNHVGGNCFNQYNTFFSLQTFPTTFWHNKS